MYVSNQMYVDISHLKTQNNFSIFVAQKNQAITLFMRSSILFYTIEQLSLSHFSSHPKQEYIIPQVYIVYTYHNLIVFCLKTIEICRVKFRLF